MRKALLVLAACLPACSAVDHQRVAGWPALEIVEHHVPHAEMQARCARYVGFGKVPEACAEFDLAAGKCHIWFSADHPPLPFIRKHELLHCEGYDHVGSDGMRRLLVQHQIRQAAAGGSR